MLLDCRTDPELRRPSTARHVRPVAAALWPRHDIQPIASAPSRHALATHHRTPSRMPRWIQPRGTTGRSSPCSRRT
eukprot:5943223-Prymnesium_polylepis.1